MIDDHAVFVVDDLGLVTELDRFAEPAFDDRTGITIVQRHDPRRAGRGAPVNDAFAGLGCDLAEPLGQHL